MLSRRTARYTRRLELPSKTSNCGLLLLLSAPPPSVASYFQHHPIPTEDGNTTHNPPTMTTATPTQKRFSPPTDCSTIKPILRKPTTTVLGARKRSIDDDDEDRYDDVQLQSSPTKKRKTVMFNENLDVKDLSREALENAKREVVQALEGHRRGDDEDYDNLKDIFAPIPRSHVLEDGGAEAPRPQNVLHYVVALAGQVSNIDARCSGLVRAVLRCTWLERDDNFARAYIELLASLAYAKGTYFPQILAMMVDKFSETRGQSSVPGFEPVDADTKKERLHLGLKYLLDLFPAGGSIILGLIATKFPYTEDSKATHMEYIDHLLRLRTDRPDLERDIMELILSRVVKLDVEMTLDLENDDDETTRAVLQQLEFSDAKGEDEDDESDLESILSEDDDDEHTKRVLMIKSKLETMDAILDLLFSLHTPIFEEPDSPKAVETFHNLLSDFSNVILPVCIFGTLCAKWILMRTEQHLKSRHTQYLLFNFALKSHQLMELFIGTLFNIAFESNRPPVVKQAAVAYLVSYSRDTGLSGSSDIIAG